MEAKINQVKIASEKYMETVGKLLQASTEVKKPRQTGKAAQAPKSSVQPNVASNKRYNVKEFIVKDC